MNRAKSALAVAAMTIACAPTRSPEPSEAATPMVVKPQAPPTVSPPAPKAVDDGAHPDDALGGPFGPKHLEAMSVAKRLPSIIENPTHNSGYGDIRYAAIDEAVRLSAPEMYATYLGGAEPELGAEYALFDDGAFVWHGPGSDVSTGVLKSWGVSTMYCSRSAVKPSRT